MKAIKRNSHGMAFYIVKTNKDFLHVSNFSTNLYNKETQSLGDEEHIRAVFNKLEALGLTAVDIHEPIIDGDLIVDIIYPEYPTEYKL